MYCVLHLNRISMPIDAFLSFRRAFVSRASENPGFKSRMAMPTAISSILFLRERSRDDLYD